MGPPLLLVLLEEESGRQRCPWLRTQWSRLVSHRTAGTEDREMCGGLELWLAHSMEMPQLLLPLLGGGKRWCQVSLRVSGTMAGRCRRLELSWILHPAALPSLRITPDSGLQQDI